MAGVIKGVTAEGRAGTKLRHVPHPIEATQDSECRAEGGAAVVVTGEEERSVSDGTGA